MAKKEVKNKKGAIELDMLAWWIIAVVVLVIIIAGIFILKGKGSGLIEHIKNLFRFRSSG